MIERTIAATLFLFLTIGSTGSALADQSGRGSIIQDVLVPAVSVSNVSLNEGDSGPTPFLFTITLSSASEQPVSVDWHTTDGTGAAPATLANHDYAPGSGTVTIAPGDSSATITVNVLGDVTWEPWENFKVVLTNPVNATLGTATGTGTIKNDDAIPNLTISDASVTEGNSGTKLVTFNVSLDHLTSADVLVDYTTIDGTATVADSDYVATSGTLDFAPKSASQTINVIVNADTVKELNEIFTVHLSRPRNAQIENGDGSATIVNDDSSTVSFSISISDVVGAEGNNGTTPFAFQVTISHSAGYPITVDFQTADGSAKVSNNDYVAASGRVTFPPGSSSQPLIVQVNGDLTLETEESFFVDLSNPIGATIADGQGRGTILNDEFDPSFFSAQWESLAVTLPSPYGYLWFVRDDHGRRIFATFDEPPNTVVLWSLSLDQMVWTRLGVVPTYPAEPVSFAYDSARDRILLMTADRSMWSMSPDSALSWTPIPFAGPRPSQRRYAAAFYDALRDQFIVSGGRSEVSYPHCCVCYREVISCDIDSYPAETWGFTLSPTPSWHLLAQEPFALEDQTLIYDSNRDRLLAFGGVKYEDVNCGIPDCSCSSTRITSSNAIYQLPLGTTDGWTVLSAEGDPPSARHFTAAVYDAASRRVLMFGGAEELADCHVAHSDRALNDTWILKLEPAPTWYRLAADGRPPAPRSNSICAIAECPGRFYVISARLEYGGVPVDSWALNFSCPGATAVVIVATELDATRESVRMRWNARGSAGRSVSIERRANGSGWVKIGSTAFDRDGSISFEDRDVIPGRRYGYRVVDPLGVTDYTSSEVWALVPESIAFELEGARPNPSSSRLVIGFRLPDRERAVLEILDIAGRRILREEVGELGAGYHNLDLSRRHSWRAGIYLLRLTRRDQVLTSRAIVAR